MLVSKYLLPNGYYLCVAVSTLISILIAEVPLYFNLTCSSNNIFCITNISVDIALNFDYRLKQDEGNKIFIVDRFCLWVEILIMYMFKKMFLILTVNAFCVRWDFQASFNILILSLSKHYNCNSKFIWLKQRQKFSLNIYILR